MVKPRENRVPIMMSEEELQAIDNWRFENHIATRSDAIRKLCKSAFVTMGSLPSARETVEECVAHAYDLHNEILDIAETPQGEQSSLDAVIYKSLELMRSAEELRLTLSSTFLQTLEITEAKTLREMFATIALVQAETEDHLANIRLRHKEWSEK